MPYTLQGKLLPPEHQYCKESHARAIEGLGTSVLGEQREIQIENAGQLFSSRDNLQPFCPAIVRSTVLCPTKQAFVINVRATSNRTTEVNRGDLEVKAIASASLNMSHLPRHLTGDSAAISEFIDRFEVRWLILQSV
jgi:hypothetical protein